MLRSRALGILAALGIGLTVLLFLPDLRPTPHPQLDSHPFRWDRAQSFQKLENDFRISRASPLADLQQAFERLERDGQRALHEIEAPLGVVPLETLARLESIQFGLAADAAAHPTLLPRAQDFVENARIAVMRSARDWPADRPDVHAALYRVLAGGRAAIEEALIQAGPDALPALVRLEDIPSATPWVEVEGVKVHSGDILLSRGGAPTSALIARGNDFPGSFSHAALVHVSPSKEATVIEALIERGTVLSTPDEYLRAKKLRILLLRLRPDLPALEADPLAPHKAATAMLNRVRQREVRYDFSMDWQNPERFFCSEVPYHAYRTVGIDLWAVKSDMSEPGLVRWLASLGVRHFTTLVPSDLEYDPRLAAIAEWRDVSMLRQHRFDDVTIDVLLQGADEGDRLGYHWYHLPVARLLKTWSGVQVLLGAVPTIPKGMSAPTALRVDALSHRVHPTLRAAIEERAVAFRRQNGYEAPYWVLVEAGRQALAEQRSRLEPALQRP
ncbi:MAG: YiiX/YebB-like N1pC/P60 family cysteine hydrolase [Gemmatimonadales bacterium]